MTTRNEEHHQLNAALRAIGADSGTWKVLEEDRERPDYVVSTPEREVGLELTEILLDDQGEHRAGERRLVRALRDVVRDFLIEQGGTGAGNMDGNVPHVAAGPHKLDIAAVADDLREHLAVYGAELANDGGIVREPFTYAWGSISEVRRVDDLGELMLMHDHRAPMPEYKQGRPQEAIEDAIVASIEKKVLRAGGYDVERPLWLALRNPNQRLESLSERCLERARSANAGCFERIFLYNDPEDVLDPRPPGPQFLDLLESR